jgi:hypothetical protein
VSSVELATETFEPGELASGRVADESAVVWLEAAVDPSAPASLCSDVESVGSSPFGNVSSLHATLPEPNAHPRRHPASRRPLHPDE